MTPTNHTPKGSIFESIKEKFQSLRPRKKESTSEEIFSKNELIVLEKAFRDILTWEPNLGYSINDLPEYQDFCTSYANYSMYYYISLVTFVGVYTAKMSCMTIGLIWREKILSNLTLPARFIFEIWSSLHYAKDLMTGISDNFDTLTFQRYLNLFENKDLAKIIDENTKVPKQFANHNLLTEYNNLQHDAKKLLLNYVRFSRRSEVIPLPFQFDYKFKYIPLRKFRESLAKYYPGAQDSYRFLSEACHPNYYRLSGFALEQYRFEIVQRTFNEVKRSLEGISNVANEIFSTSIPNFLV